MFTADFHDALGSAIPSVVGLFKHDNGDVRYSAVSVLGRLAENGQLYSTTIVTEADIHLKPIFVMESWLPLDHSLRCSNMTKTMLDLWPFVYLPD